MYQQPSLLPPEPTPSSPATGRLTLKPEAEIELHLYAVAVLKAGAMTVKQAKDAVQALRRLLKSADRSGGPASLATLTTMPDLLAIREGAGANKNGDQKVRDRAIVGLSCWSGLRWQEIAALSWEQFNWDESPEGKLFPLSVSCLRRGELIELPVHSNAASDLVELFRRVRREVDGQALKAENSGHRVVVTRLGIVMGREGGALRKMLPLFNFGLGGPLGSGRQWWPWVHVDDVVDALARAVSSDWRGVYNLAAPQPVRQREFARGLGSAMHKPALAPVPALVLRLAQGEFADEILFGKRVLPERLLQAGFRFTYPEVGSALRALVGKEDGVAAVPSRT